jgi:hypothetical protein
MSNDAPAFVLTIPADPALAVTARTFVACSARALDLDEELCEDLRLAANELFATVAETGSGKVSFRLEDRGKLTVEGVGDLERASEDLPFRRGDLLRAMFPDVRQTGTTVVVDRRPTVDPR